MRTGEQFECSNCFHKGHLDRHGRCECCHSQAVMSLALIELLLGLGATNDFERVTT